MNTKQFSQLPSKNEQATIALQQKNRSRSNKCTRLMACVCYVMYSSQAQTPSSTQQRELECFLKKLRSGQWATGKLIETGRNNSNCLLAPPPEFQHKQINHGKELTIQNSFDRGIEPILVPCTSV